MASTTADAEQPDLDVVLLQMSQTFNKDLDRRNTAAASSSSSSVTPPDELPHLIDTSDDHTMKWRGLLNNKFASARRARRTDNVDHSPDANAPNAAADPNNVRVLRRHTRTPAQNATLERLRSKSRLSNDSASLEAATDSNGAGEEAPVDAEMQPVPAKRSKGRPKRTTNVSSMAENDGQQSPPLFEPKVLRARRSTFGKSSATVVAAGDASNDVKLEPDGGKTEELSNGGDKNDVAVDGVESKSVDEAVKVESLDEDSGSLPADEAVDPERELISNDDVKDENCSAKKIDVETAGPVECSAKLPIADELVEIPDESSAEAASVEIPTEQPETQPEPVVKVPKKRGRKPGYRKPISVFVEPTKKSARNLRDSGNGMLNNVDAPQQRLSRRIKPTAKILANDELRYGFELQNNARLSLSTEQLDIAPAVVAVAAIEENSDGPSKVVRNGVDANHANSNAENAYASVYPLARSQPCPDPDEFINSIKKAKINLHRSPEVNLLQLTVKQKRRLFKRKEKHLHKLGLLRRNKLPTQESSSVSGQPPTTSTTRPDDEPAPRMVVEKPPHHETDRPSVTLRLRADPTPNAGDPNAGHSSASASSRKRTYEVVKSPSETTLVLGLKNRRPDLGQPMSPLQPMPPLQPIGDRDASLAAALICLCASPSNYYTRRTATTAYCRAIDEIAGQRIGCCNLAVTMANHEATGDADALLLNLRRPSVRVAYNVLCSVHQHRLSVHQSCAGCGVFCTHGRFAMCSRRHLFHRDCATKFILHAPPQPPPLTASNGSAFVAPQLVLRCPHCGSDAPERETTIAMHCAGLGAKVPPVFVPDQRSIVATRMSIGPHTYASAGSVNGRSTTWELEKLIPSQVQDVVLRAEAKALSEPRDRRAPYGSKDVVEAINNDDLELAMRIIADGFDISAPLAEFRRGSCLHLVVNFGSLAMAYLMLSRSPPANTAYLNRRDRELRTPLMCAVLGAKNETIRMLVQCGADVTVRGPGGMTALHLAAKTGNFTAAKIMLESYRLSTGANRFVLFVNAVDDGGWTTIVWAAEIGHSRMVEYLVQCGADLSVCDAERNTVLHWAALSDDVATVKPLLLGADLNVQNVNGDTPLHIACRNSNTRMCLIFLAHGASLELQNDLGERAYDGIQDVHGPCARAIEFNMKLRELARFDVSTVISQDISNGRETYPIKLIGPNGNEAADDVSSAAEVPKFHYITKSIVLRNAKVQVDGRVSQMRVCECTDNCATLSCLCGEISVQNWYNMEGRLNGSFDFGDPSMIFECNDVCGCNKLLCRNRVVQRGANVALQVLDYGQRKGWGVSAVGDVARGTFVAEYVGETLTGTEAMRRKECRYLFDLDDEQTHCIDAHLYGNVSRFFNHSCEPNVAPIRVFYDHQDLRFPKIAFFAMRNIAADEEITFDYGDRFWLNRDPSLQCECRTKSCRYRRATDANQPSKQKTWLVPIAPATTTPTSNHQPKSATDTCRRNVSGERS